MENITKEKLTQLFQEKEIEYKADRLLAIDRGYKHDFNMRLDEFIIKFLSNINRNFNTVYADDTSNVQCYLNRNRSLGDIYKICLSYYPDATLLEVLEILYTAVNENTEGICSLYCNTIYKRVYNHQSRGHYHWLFLEDDDHDTDRSSYDREDEFGLMSQEYRVLFEDTKEIILAEK